MNLFKPVEIIDIESQTYVLRLVLLMLVLCPQMLFPLIVYILTITPVISRHRVFTTRDVPIIAQPAHARPAPGRWS